jgi:hypothetical protein
VEIRREERRVIGDIAVGRSRRVGNGVQDAPNGVGPFLRSRRPVRLARSTEAAECSRAPRRIPSCEWSRSSRRLTGMVLPATRLRSCGPRSVEECRNAAFRAGRARAQGRRRLCAPRDRAPLARKCRGRRRTEPAALRCASVHHTRLLTLMHRTDPRWPKRRRCPSGAPHRHPPACAKIDGVSPV